LTEKAGLCWGDNSLGEVGDGTTTNRSAPVIYERVSGITGITTNGYGHSCDVTTSGSARCWGFNAAGQLGDGSTTDRLGPTPVIELRSAVVIAAGSIHTCALIDTGAASCWGGNQYGQIGDGTTTNRLSPVAVRGMRGGITAITAGFAHTCALVETGAVKCWGVNLQGELGDGTTTARFTPGFVRKFQHGGAVALAAGDEHNCAVSDTGGIWCWGYNDSGQLGDGTTTNRLTPVRVRGFPR